MGALERWAGRAGLPANCVAEGLDQVGGWPARSALSAGWCTAARAALQKLGAPPLECVPGPGRDLRMHPRPLVLPQTRGWFYTLMVLSTALFDKPAFKVGLQAARGWLAGRLARCVQRSAAAAPPPPRAAHCAALNRAMPCPPCQPTLTPTPPPMSPSTKQNLVCNGLVLAADGKKMSKRLKNYPVRGAWEAGWGALAGRSGVAGGAAGAGAGPCAAAASMRRACQLCARRRRAERACVLRPVPAPTPAGPDGGGEQVRRRRAAPLPHQLARGAPAAWPLRVAGGRLLPGCRLARPATLPPPAACFPLPRPPACCRCTPRRSSARRRAPTHQHASDRPHPPLFPPLSIGRCAPRRSSSRRRACMRW